VTLLAVTATVREADAVLAGLPGDEACRLGPYEARRSRTGAGQLLVVVGGIGPAAAAAAAGTALALVGDTSLALCLGIAGGFTATGTTVGDVVVGTCIAFADLGAGSPNGFLDHASLGWGPAGVETPPEIVAAARERIEATGRVVRTGPVLTVSAGTGTASRGAELQSRHAAVAEAMEGAGVATAAAHHGRPVLEVRTISNAVGDRNLADWDIPIALDALTDACAALLREPLPC
jgi:futalosine hydrolase